MNKLFGTDGIRGRSNCYPITPEVALQLGKAIGHMCKASGHHSKRAVIGKDTRLSGYMLETALTSGLVSVGMDVFLVGPVPTPALAHLTRSLCAEVGLMLTASHNPFDDNGIKIFGSDGFKLSDEQEDAITNEVLNGELSADHIRSDALGKAYRIEDARGRYIEFVKSTAQSQSLEGLKIVLDCANGASYFIAPLIFQELGAEVIKAFAEPDGYNINNGCGALHPETIAKLVKKHKADLGVAFDGDADRVIFCDAKGRPVDGDRILSMCAIDYKERGKLAKDTLVVTAMSNLGLHEAMKKHDIRVETTDVGDRNVIQRMRENGYTLGGEKSGHLIFMDYVTTGDGIITALQVLKLVKQKKASLAELSDCMKEYPQELINLPVKEKKPIEGLPTLQAVIQEAKANMKGEGRILVRYSGTENKIRILVEAREKALVKEWSAKAVKAVQQDL